MNDLRNHDTYYKVGQILAKKWAPLLEGVKGEYNILSTAILLENEQRKGGELISETTLSGNTGALSASPNIGAFQHYLLPLVRRVYPNLVTNELVGVQPMTSPASLVFYLKYKYSGLTEQMVSNNRLVDTPTAKGGTAAGTEYANFIGDTWFIDPYYSLQTNYREAMSVADGDATLNITVNARPMLNGSAELYLLISDTDPGSPASLDASSATLRIAKASYINGTLTVEYQTRLLGSASPTITTPSITIATGAVTSTVTGFVVTSACALTNSTYSTVAELLAANDIRYANTITYDYNMENQRNLPEIELTVESYPVTAKSRKLRTKWSVEASQDLRAMHNVDAEQELIALLANEIAAEIDREVLNTLITNAGIRVTYDYNDPFITGGIVSTGSPATALSVFGAGNFDDRNKSLFYQILEVSNQIYRQSLRGSGNWVVTSPEIGAKLESLREFSTDADADFTYNIGIQFSGVLNNKFKVFKDPLFPKDLILVGYKGESFMDAGFFYCPYVPLQITPTVLDPESFNPRKGLMTRYGTVFVENGPRMYGVIKVDNLTAKGVSASSNFGLDAVTLKSAQKSGRALIDAGSDLV